MGVLPCGRDGCDNILCDRYSYAVECYLCYECFEELVGLGPGGDIEEFLCKTCNDVPDPIDSYKYWDEIFTLNFPREST
jgi:hypothetical protein